jgi:polyvinyl alcohol dehydrogenase (cytochrome)
MIKKTNIKTAVMIALCWSCTHFDAIAQSTASWPSSGRDVINSRFQDNETLIKTSNVGTMKVKWTFTTEGDVSATPTMANNVVYAPDWGGNLFAIRADTGQQIWRHQIAEYDGISGSISRVSPLVLGNKLVIGDNVQTDVEHDGARIIALDASSGAMLWSTQVDSHPTAVITGSPTAFNNVIYVGVSSLEESVPNHECCTFRGSVVALNVDTGAILWKTYTVPDNQGSPTAYSGAGVWQPVAIDATRKLLYFGTGNNYSVPPSVAECQANAISTAAMVSCTSDDDHIDSAMALDISTGTIKWARKMVNYDTWTVACLRPIAGLTCPSPAGMDFDFSGAGPNVVASAGIVAFGQKNGTYWALNEDTGATVWSRMVGPGGVEGGLQWGTACDGKIMYLAVSNSENMSYTLFGKNGPTINWGLWTALDVKTGNFIWQTADPTPGAHDLGAVSVADGVMYAGSSSGAMYAFDAKVGTILWKFDSGGSVFDGPSIVNGVVYWGSGYRRHGDIGNNKIYAFAPSAK